MSQNVSPYDSPALLPPFQKKRQLMIYSPRRRRATSPSRPPRPPDLWRAIHRSPRVDRRQSGREHRRHRRRTLAHVWYHPLPVARGLSSHAGRAHDLAPPPEELLPSQSCSGCTTLVRQVAKSGPGGQEGL